MDSDPQLALGTAVDIDPGDAGNPLDAVLNNVGGEVAIAVHGAVVAVEAAQHEPGDGLVLGAGGPQGRLIDLGRIAGYPVKAVGHQQQCPVHILADLEFEGQP
jgi:hypothetical protein